MAFDRFKKAQKSTEQTEPKHEETTKPFVVSVNPYVSPLKALDLIARINSAQHSSRFNHYLNEINNILNKLDFKDFMKNNRRVLSNQDLFIELNTELTALITAIDNESFGNKPRVRAAVAGAFNAGKSSLLNKFIGKRILPEDIVPATSVPAYIYCQTSIAEIRVFGENNSGTVMGLDEQVLSYISHSTANSTAQQIATSLKRFIVEIPHKEFQNLVFIDTPGYENIDGDNEVSNDDIVASTHIDNSDFMIYLVPSYKGGIPAEDWKRIDRYPRPAIIILTKNDIQPAQDAKDVFEMVCSEIDKHPNVVDVISISALNDDLYLSRSGFSVEKIFNIVLGHLKRGTEIERKWNEISALLNTEIKWAESEYEKLKDKISDTQKKQNEAQKYYLEIIPFLGNQLKHIRETLIDDINKNSNEVNEVLSRFITYRNDIIRLSDGLVEYYDDLWMHNDKLRNIINEILDKNSSSYDFLRKMTEDYGKFYNEEYREGMVTNISLAFDEVIKMAKEQLDAFSSETQQAQSKMKTITEIIEWFKKLSRSLSDWYKDTLQNLKHVASTIIVPTPVPNIFQAIEDMDQEMLISSLTQPTDITTQYNNNGYSPLTYAAACGNITALRIMLNLTSFGDRVKETIRDQHNRTMADAATESHQHLTSKFLEDHFKNK